jgi:hypothetical protein
MSRCTRSKEGISMLDSEEHLATTLVLCKEGEGNFQGRKKGVSEGE